MSAETSQIISRLSDSSKVLNNVIYPMASKLLYFYIGSANLNINLIRTGRGSLSACGFAGYMSHS